LLTVGGHTVSDDLRDKVMTLEIYGKLWVTEADYREQADRIEALERERDALKIARGSALRLGVEQARSDALEAAALAIEALYGHGMTKEHAAVIRALKEK
jgi:hypothetical protein